MAEALPKAYEPKEVEGKWRSHWESTNAFAADPEASGAPYSIVIPPPNVTGSLHMGHALNLTLQDVLCRRRRQLGDKVLWVPGSDHAGIATQNVVEKKLAKEGKSRRDLGREAFVAEVWKWKEEYGGRIQNQIRMLGASVDWTRERFTLDEGLSKAVREVFVRLFNEGLVYKGKYIINWCPRCHTALADDEVEHAPTKGTLTHIRYPLAPRWGMDRELVVATTRPETMLGDTAAAVHPEDERYADLIGKTVLLPLVGREIPVIADPYVDKEFGTGALKVTPAHDFNDWELGQRHKLEVIQIMDGSATIVDPAPAAYIGLTREEARKQVLADLEAGGHLVEVKPHDHAVGGCYRCKSVIEPYVSEQWFVAVKSLAEKARAAVPEKTRIHPDNWAKVYHQWLDNIRDWCISRQLWWGHRIPAWTCEGCGEIVAAVETPTVCPKCEGSTLVQEEDVLDTWFSSALWPFSTMGWPDKTKELATFYPTSVLVTAFDILFFWVARMMMMGVHFMGEVPFKDLYIHALVRDAEGKKMSKSTGNVIDPLDVIEKFGTDSLRFTLAVFAAMGRDIRLSEDRIEGSRNFVNKLWNAARFALMKLPEAFAETPDPNAAGALHHAWILHRLEEVKTTVDQALGDYHFNDAAQALYTFIWREFCDWYLECVKAELNSEDAAVREPAQAVLYTVLKETLVLLHPFTPFVTAEIWTRLPGAEPTDLAFAPSPAAAPRRLNPKALADMTFFQETVTAVRTIRAELNINPALELTLLVKSGDERVRSILEDNLGNLRFLARLGAVEIGAGIAVPKAAAGAVVGASFGGVELFVPLAGAIDFAAETARIEKELGKVEKELGVVSKKLGNPGFVDKAPAEVVDKEREKLSVLTDKKAKMEALRQKLADMGN